MPMIASVSLHALARRFQRGWTTTDAAVMEDLRALALWQGGGGEFSVPVADGFWVGSTRETTFAGQTQRSLLVRTFLV